MTQTQAIVGIHGAVDRRVQEDLSARLRVAQLLPAYYLDPNLQWYDEFQEWIGEEAEEGVSDVESGRTHGDAGVVRQGLAEFVDEQADGRMRARLMFAVAIAARAFPEMDESESELHNHAIAALQTVSTSAAKATEQANDLYRLLASDKPVVPGGAPPGTVAWWRELNMRTFTKKSERIGLFPKPCTGRLLTVPGIRGPVAALRTEYRSDEIAFDAALRFLEPSNWETCMPDFWCVMQAIPEPDPLPGVRRYHEIVSTHCRNPAAPGFWAETELLFNFMWIPDKDHAVAAVANYELARQPQASDRILVDEGTLVISKVDGAKALLITTTKRVKFSYPFSSQQVALLTCALGYADFSGQLLACAARYGKNFEGTPFPGVAPEVTSAPGLRPVNGKTGLGGLCRDGVEIWASGFRECATALERDAGVPSIGMRTRRSVKARARRWNPR